MTTRGINSANCKDEGGLKTTPIASHSVAVEALQEYPKTQIGFWEQEDLL